MKLFVHTAVAAAVAAMAGGVSAANIALSTDIVVVGGGSAGLTAAVAAADKGKKVILLEKNPMVGGATQFAEGIFAVESELQRLRSDTLTREKAFETLMEKHAYFVDSAKTRDFVYGSAENVEWLRKHGINFEVIRMTPWEEATWHVITDYKGMKGTDHGHGMIYGLKDNAVKLGVDIRTSTPATSLIKSKSGRIVGVKAKAKNGDVLTISSKAVILASGGFGDDPNKIRDWAHRDPKAWLSSAPINKTGDGIQMAIDAGSKLGNVTFCAHTHAAGPGLKFLSNLYATTWQPSALWVDKNGNRVANEEVVMSFSQSANTIYEALGHHVWSIWDDAQVKYMMEKGVDSGIGVLVPVGTKLPDLQKDIDEALAAKSPVFKAASSVAALAKQIGVPVANLEAAVARYNHGCEEGHDGEFFKNVKYMRKLNTKKLYAIQLTGGYFSSIGGLRTSLKHEVLDKNDKPMPGLYAAGLEVSNVVGPTYMTWSSGYAFGYACYSGRHAGENAAAAIDARK
jgi:fumarate reductase flavoprotein subunit